MSEKPQDEEVTDEEDAYSASEQAYTFQPTVPVAPKFICGERLEKRKEVVFSSIFFLTNKQYLVMCMLLNLHCLPSLVLREAGGKTQGVGERET